MFNKRLGFKLLLLLSLVKDYLLKQIDKGAETRREYFSQASDKRS